MFPLVYCNCCSKLTMAIYVLKLSQVLVRPENQVFCFLNQALVKVVKMQQEEAEREREKEEEEKRQIREQNKRVKRMLEAAFDGDLDEMEQILKEVVYVYQHCV